MGVALINRTSELDNKSSSVSVGLRELSKQYPDVLALNSLSLDIKPGEFLTILGPSGSGKTTALELIAGLNFPTSGRVLIGDQDVTSVDSANRQVGIVFQDYALFPHMSVFDNVAFPLAVRRTQRREIQRRVDDALAMVRLEGLSKRRPHQLSGGQQQRVALARATVFQPRVLLLDEPLGALDKGLRDEMQVELKRLQRELGITTIMVTHDQDEALSLSDRVAVLREGELQQCASPTELYRSPLNRFVAEFIGIANLFEAVQSPTVGSELVRFRIGDSWIERPAELPLAMANNGSAYLAMIRPEDIRLGDRNEVDSVLGVVKESAYLGSRTRYQVAVQESLLEIEQRDLGTTWRVGDEVWITVERDQITLVPEARNSASSTA